MKKLRALWPLLFTSTLLLTACGQGAAHFTSTGPASWAGLTTIKVATLGMDPLLDAEINAFTVKYPDIRVEKVPVNLSGEQSDPALAAKLRQGEVDVVPGLPGLIQQNLLQSLDSDLQHDALDTRPYGEFLSRLRSGGQLYDLPFALSPTVVVYNLDLLQASGGPAPVAGWTWEQFRQVARGLSRGQGDRQVWGATLQVPERLVELMLQQRVPGQAPSQTDRPSLEQALTFAGNLTGVDQSMPKVAVRDWTNPAAVVAAPNLFTMGKAGMTLQELSFLGTLAESLRFKYDVALLPTWAGQTTRTPVRYRTYGLAASSQHHAAAWQFLRFISGPEGAVVAAHGGWLPAYITPSVKKAWFDHKPTPPLGTEALFSTQWAPAARTGDAKAAQWLANAANRVLSGTQAPAAAAQRFVQQMQQKTAAGY